MACDHNMNLVENCEPEVVGILEIHVHHARNIHNICIYDNQDVYAKFSLTCDPDEALSTAVVPGGGKNPDFNERLVLRIGQIDAVVKCEIWMLSRARKFMEDQLLGFALVPISHVAGKGRVTGDYTLSSTDLFHSPAGTVHLSLSLSLDAAPDRLKPPESSSSVSSEAALLDRIEYSRIEFPDINAVSENQKMVSEYVTSRQPQFASFLHLGAANSPENSTGFVSSTTTSLSDDSNSGDKRPITIISDPNQNLGSSPNTPTSIKGSEQTDQRDIMREEQCAMQKQIVDMYMRSVHQFTESLAKMKLPMDLDKPELAMDGGDLIQARNGDAEMETTKKKKDGSRVFYGSRAFF